MTAVATFDCTLLLNIKYFFCYYNRIKHILGVSQEGRFRDVPLVRSKQQNIGTRAVHLVRLTRMNGLFLNCLYLKSI